MLILDHAQNLLKKEKEDRKNELDENESFVFVPGSFRYRNGNWGKWRKIFFNELFGETPTKISPIQSQIWSTEPLSIKVIIPLEVAKPVLFDNSKEGRPIETVTSRKITRNRIPKCLNYHVKGHCITDYPQPFKLCPYWGKFAHRNVLDIIKMSCCQNFFKFSKLLVNSKFFVF